MKNKLIYIVLLIALIFPTYSFFLGDKMFTFNDETQMANFHQYSKSIDLGQFPPRWAVDMEYEYGSPFPQFNYQLPYYLGYLGHLAKIPITVTFKLLLALTLIFGAVGMFILGMTITGSTLTSIFVGVLYTYTPYQSIDHYVRGAIGEAFALAIFPWLFLVCYKLLQKVSVMRVVSAGLVFGLLIISHQPAALFTIPIFLGVFGLTAILNKRFDSLISIVKSIVLGLIFSAYYWIPVILEKKFIVTGGPFKYIDQFPFIWQLIYSRWTYHGANPFSTDTFSFQIGLINIFVLILSCIFLVTTFFKKLKKAQDVWLFRVVVLATFSVIFLMNIRSDFVWRAIPLIQVIQFPWRLLMFTTLFTSVIYLFLIKFIPKFWSNFLTFTLLVLSIFLNASYFHPGLIVDYKDDYYLHRFLPRVVLRNGESISSNYLQHTEDYVSLPIGAVRPTILPSSKLTAKSKLTTIKVVSNNPLRYKAIIEPPVTEIVTFHTFYFPGWEVKVDGFPAKIIPDDKGVITFEIPKGKHEVEISFTDTPIRLISNIISLSSLIFVGSYSIYYIIKKRATPTT